MNTKYTISLLLALAASNMIVSTSVLGIKKEELVDRSKRTQLGYMSGLLSNRGKDAYGKALVTPAQFLAAAGGNGTELDVFNYSPHVKNLKNAIDALTSNAHVKKIIDKSGTMAIGDATDIFGAGVVAMNPEDLRKIFEDMGQMSGKNKTKHESHTAGLIFDISQALLAARNSLYKPEETLELIVRLAAASNGIGRISEGEINVSGLTNPTNAQAAINGRFSASTMAQAISQQINALVVGYLDSYNNIKLDTPLFKKALNIQEIFVQFRSIVAAGMPNNDLFTAVNGTVIDENTGNALITAYNNYLAAGQGQKDGAATTFMDALCTAHANGANMPAVFDSGAALGGAFNDAGFKSMLVDGHARKLTANLEEISDTQENIRELAKTLARGTAGTLDEKELKKKGSRLSESADLAQYMKRLDEIIQPNIDSIETPGARDAAIVEIQTIKDMLGNLAIKLKVKNPVKLGNFSITKREFERLSKMFQEKSDKTIEALNKKFPKQQTEEEKATAAALKAKTDAIEAFKVEAGKLKTNSTKGEIVAAAIKMHALNLSEEEKESALAGFDAAVVKNVNEALEASITADKNAEAKAAKEAKEKEEKAKKIADTKALVAALTDKATPQQLNAVVAALTGLGTDAQAIIDSVQDLAVKANIEKARITANQVPVTVNKKAATSNKTSTSGSRGRGSRGRVRGGNRKQGRKAKSKIRKIIKKSKKQTSKKSNNQANKKANG